VESRLGRSEVQAASPEGGILIAQLVRAGKRMITFRINPSRGDIGAPLTGRRDFFARKTQV